MLIRVVYLASRNVAVLLAAVVIAVALLCSPALSQGRGGVPAGYSNATAQGVAEIMAYYGRVGHFGGNPGYEGCGCGPTKEKAYAICCYANSGMRTVDVGNPMLSMHSCREMAAVSDVAPMIRVLTGLFSSFSGLDSAS